MNDNVENLVDIMLFLTTCNMSRSQFKTNLYVKILAESCVVFSPCVLKYSYLYIDQIYIFYNLKYILIFKV